MTQTQKEPAEGKQESLLISRHERIVNRLIASFCLAIKPPAEIQTSVSIDCLGIENQGLVNQNPSGKKQVSL